MKTWIVIISFLTVVFSVGISRGAEEEVPKANGWDLVQTEHFAIHTNAQVRTVKKLAQEMEGLRAMLSLVAPDGILRSSRPTTIFVFKSRKNFAPFLPIGDDGRRQTNVGGYFLNRYDGNFMTALAGSFNDYSFQSSLHEYVHFVINHTMPSVPAWFNEGVAQYYGTFSSKAGSVEVGRVSSQSMMELQRGWALPVEDLMGVDYQSPIYRGAGSIRRTFYAESWALVHYFFHGSPQRLAQLQNYLQLLNNGTDRHVAFSNAFKIEYSVLQQEVRTYIKSELLPILRVPKENLRFDDRVEVREVPVKEMRCRLGELMAHIDQGELERAELIFDSVVSSHPKEACALRGLGFVAREQGLRDRAEELLSKAQTLSPEDYLTLLYRGENLSMRARESSDEEGESESAESAAADTQMARKLFRRAIEVEPEWGEAWVELGRTWSREEKPPGEALESLLHGLELMPFRDDVAISLAQMYVRLGLPDHVSATMGGSVRGRLPEETLALVDGMVQDARWNAARRLQEAGDLEGAVASLEVILADQPDEERKERVEEMILALRSAIDSVGKAPSGS